MFGLYMFKFVMKILVIEEDCKICLIEKEINILKFFYCSIDGVVVCDILLYEVWGYNVGVIIYMLEIYIYWLC